MLFYEIYTIDGQKFSLIIFFSTFKPIFTLLLTSRMSFILASKSEVISNIFYDDVSTVQCLPSANAECCLIRRWPDIYKHGIQDWKNNTDQRCSSQKEHLSASWGPNCGPPKTPVHHITNRIEEFKRGP